MKNKKKKNGKQPMKYWLVEIALTSGDTLQFYVSAINQFEANIKADGYAALAAGDESLRKFYGKFKLLP